MMFFQKSSNCISFYLLFVQILIASHGLQSPCKNIFEYIYDGNEWMGQIKINPPKNMELIVLNVTLSIGVILPTRYVGTLELDGTRTDILDNLLKGQPLMYKLRFPLPSPIPKVTVIRLNNDVICIGPPVTNNIVTTMTLEHTLTIPQQYFNSNENTFIRKLQNSFRNNNFANDLSNRIFNQFSHSNDQQGGGFNNYHQIFQHVPSSFVPPKNEFAGGEQINPSSNHYYPFSNNYPQVKVFSNSDNSNVVFDGDITQNSPSNNGRRVEVNNPKRNKAPDTQTSDNTAEICGLSESVNPLVVKGNQTHKGQYPWIAAIFVQVIRGLEFKCSGTLISHQHIVTAAHCIQIYNNPKLNPEDVVIFLGKHNIRKWTTEENSLIAEVQNITLHPEFEPDTLGFGSDIAVITLTKRVKYTRYIRPACLWTTNTDLRLIYNQNGVVTGWGRDEKGNRMTHELLQTQLPIVTQEDCLRSNSRFPIITSNRTFCAGERNGVGPCNGDSGGGFIMHQNNRWVLRGIVSVSLLDKVTLSCDLNQYVVFTDAAKYIDWLLTFLVQD